MIFSCVQFQKAKSGMTTELCLLLLQGLGLGTSAALTGEYLFVPRFCRHGGGCEVVRKSMFASILGIPTPIVGLCFFLALSVFTVMPSLRRFLVPSSLLGGAGGAGFLFIQAFYLRAFCPLCVIVDTTSILLAVAAFSRRDTMLPVRPKKHVPFFLFLFS